MNTPPGLTSTELPPDFSVIPAGHSITMPAFAVRWILIAVMAYPMVMDSFFPPVTESETLPVMLSLWLPVTERDLFPVTYSI